MNPKTAKKGKKKDTKPKKENQVRTRQRHKIEKQIHRHPKTLKTPKRNIYEIKKFHPHSLSKKKSI